MATVHALRTTSGITRTSAVLCGRVQWGASSHTAAALGRNRVTSRELFCRSKCLQSLFAYGKDNGMRRMWYSTTPPSSGGSLGTGLNVTRGESPPLGGVTIEQDIARTSRLQTSRFGAEFAHSQVKDPPTSSAKPSSSSKDDEGTSRLSPTQTSNFVLTLYFLEAAPFRTLLHPLQPLSHVASQVSSFLNVPSQRVRIEAPAGTVWAAHIQLTDFIRECRGGFDVVVLSTSTADAATPAGPTAEDVRVTVRTPDFWQRTRFLRARYAQIVGELGELRELKRECDRLAQRGARRLAQAGLGCLVAWWGTVFSYTFLTEIGWDGVEPVTYLVGLTGVIAGYVWFLNHNREVTYGSVLDSAVSTRQERLYKEKGFQVERWAELTEEGREIRRVLMAIAREYEVRWEGIGADIFKEDEAEKNGEKATGTEKSSAGKIEGSGTG